MSQSIDTLQVDWNGRLVGYLDQMSGREMSFRYADDYLASPTPRPISQSLPLQAEAFDPPVTRAWFTNLLPEGEIRGHVARRLGISERNDFALLKAIGGDCAGALRLLPVSSSGVDAGELIPLPWDELEARIAATPRPSLLALILQDGELRLSLAGAQDKLPVHCRDGRLSLPTGDAASTHLLKISSGGFPDLVQNELFCLTLARAIGLDVPHTELAPTATPILLIERYDRRVDDDASVHRLHQEDFCQALGVPPETKYENEGGPTLAQMFEVLAHGSQSPLPDKKSLLTWVLFNVLIGNADAHAKNVSLLYGQSDAPARRRLAPFYDLVCTAVYDQLSTRLAQKIGGEYRVEHVASRHWDRLAESIGVKSGYLRSLGLEICDRVAAAAPAIATEIGEAHSAQATLERIARVIERRVSRVRGALDR